MQLSQSQSAAAQVAYSQLMDVLVSRALSRGVEHLSGSFAEKTVKGRRYAYYSYREGRRVRQIYIGAVDERLQRLIARHREGKDARKAVAPLVRACVVQGAMTLDPTHLKLLRQLDEAGLFRAGGVLVGTHAFVACGNLLGVRWGDAVRTTDLDFAHAGHMLSLALPGNLSVDLHDQLIAAEAGFVPAILSTGQAGVTYTDVRDSTRQVDFLTPLGRKQEPHYLKALNVHAQPLPYIEFLLENVTQAVLMSNSGDAVLATVPAPERYGVHKLLVSQLRPARESGKARKDLQQARALFEALDEDIWAEAVDDARSRGPTWSRLVTAGLEKLGG